MHFPDMAFKEVLFWAIAVVVGGIIAGGATNMGGIIVKKLWFRDGHDRRHDESDFLTELLRMHREYVESNNQMFHELRHLAESIQAFTDASNRAANRAFDEHREIKDDTSKILREVRAIAANQEID